MSRMNACTARHGDARTLRQVAGLRPELIDTNRQTGGPNTCPAAPTPASTARRRAPDVPGKAGIPNASVSVRQRVHLSGEAKRLTHGTLESTSDAIVSEGITSKAAVDAALANLAAHTADPGSVIAEPRTFQVWATRPASLL
jgi:hypothetical protein